MMTCFFHAVPWMKPLLKKVTAWCGNATRAAAAKQSDNAVHDPTRTDMDMTPANNPPRPDIFGAIKIPPQQHALIQYEWSKHRFGQWLRWTVAEVSEATSKTSQPGSKSWKKTDGTGN